MNRNEAIETVGMEAVEAVERENCEPTCRVGYNGACQDNELTEWRADYVLEDGRIISAYYYTTNEQDAIMAEYDGDGSYIDWQISHYEVN